MKQAVFMGWHMDNKVDDIPNISGYIIASVLTQFLALMFFFLALAGFMTGSVIGGVILVVLGGLCEFLFVKMIQKILFWKRKEKEGTSQAPEEAVFADSLYRNDGESYETARRLYCEQHGKKAGKLTGEDEDIIWQYTYGDFAYLLMWVIDNGFYRPSKDYDEDQAEEAKAEIAKIRKREALPTDFLNDFGGFFMEDEVAKKACGFVKEYRAGSFLDDVRSFAKDDLGAELYGFPFRWEDYDAFKPKIDEAYKKYQEDNSQPEK